MTLSRWLRRLGGATGGDSEIASVALSMGAAILVLGATFGALATASGVSVLLTCAMSLVMYAGGAQFLALSLVTGGAGAASVIGSGVLLNARHLPFGLALSGSIPGRGWRRLMACHLLTDEVTAVTLRFLDPVRARRAYLVVGIGNYLTWNLGTFAGALAGQAVADAQALGLDAAFPASILALLAPHLRDRTKCLAALAGASLALAMTPLLPVGAPVLVAAAGGLIVGLFSGRGTANR